MAMRRNFLSQRSVALQKSLFQRYTGRIIEYIRGEIVYIQGETFKQHRGQEGWRVNSLESGADSKIGSK